MASCQSTIKLVARWGLIDGSGCNGPHQRHRPWHLRLAAHRCHSWSSPQLRGRSILVVEDEQLIGMDIRAALEKAGAFVTATTTVRHALILIDHDGLAGAIIDHALGDGHSAEVCVRLKSRGIPYVSYSGYDPGGRQP
jgi:PleD family two-component response regulator